MDNWLKGKSFLSQDNTQSITKFKASVAAINVANDTGGTNKIKGISKLNNFEFSEDGIRVWCAYQIGPGRLLSYEGMKPQEKTGTKLL